MYVCMYICIARVGVERKSQRDNIEYPASWATPTSVS